MGLTPGVKLGPYEIAGLVGSGGMGEVYRARDHRLGRDVAVKVLPESVRTDPERLRRFEQEARSAGALDHPNILAVHDFHAEGEVPYLVAELLEGSSLRELLDRGGRDGRLETRRAVGLAIQMARGLAAAHEKGVIHRDLKPENLFVLKDGRLKILDFGLAKAVSSPALAGGTLPANDAAPVVDPTRDSLTRTGGPGGSAGYMAPEQIEPLPGRVIDHRADIFAFGAVLYELLTGERAFPGATHVERAYSTLRDQPPLLARIGLDASLGLERLVRHCLEKDPSRRFQSTQDLLFQLEEIEERMLAGEARGHAAASPQAQRASFFSSPSTVTLGLSIVLVLGAAVLTGTFGRLFEAVTSLRGAPAVPSRTEVLPEIPTPPRVPDDQPHYQRVTFRRGDMEPARFAPDGKTIIHTGFFGGEPPRVYATQPGIPEARALTPPGTTLLAVSSAGEMAILIWPKDGKSKSVLARASIVGGAARQVLEGVLAADWSPDGKELAVLVRDKGRDRLEYPVGHVLLEAPAQRLAEYLRVSPDGRSVAFFNYPVPRDDRGTVEMVGVDGEHRRLSGPWYSLRGLAWSPDGREVWFGASERGTHYKVRAVDLAGHDRVVLEQAGPVRPEDIAPDGRALVMLEHRGSLAFAVRPDEDDRPRDVSWLDFTHVTGLSADGKKLVFGEIAESAVNETIAFVRDLEDTSEPVRLGEGMVWSISPDGRFALISPRAPYHRLVLTPTGVGQARDLSIGDDETVTKAAFFPDGRHIALEGEDGAGLPRVFRLDLDSGVRVPLTAPGHRMVVAPSPDGRALVVGDVEHRLFEVSVPPPSDPPRVAANGGVGKLTPITNLPGAWWPIDWTEDGRGFFVRNIELRLSSLQLGVFDRTSGQVARWRQLEAPEAVGAQGIGVVLISRDGGTIVYQVSQKLGELYLAEGLR